MGRHACSVPPPPQGSARLSAAEANDLDEEAVRYRPRPPVPSKLDPYKAIIDARLAEYPKLTATRLFKEVRDAGYPGSYSQVKRYVRRVRPRPPEEPVQRLETPPGHQGQVDFADFRLPWGRRHALIVVLGYTRLMWLQYYERQTMPVVMRGLESAFRYFGGVPSEVLFDQMKARNHNPGIGDAPVMPAPKDPAVCMTRWLAGGWWKKAEKLASLDPRHGRGWHSLRRKFASDLMDLPLKVLCDLGGWKTAQTVLQCYQRPDEDRLRDALEEYRGVVSVSN